MLLPGASERATKITSAPLSTGDRDRLADLAGQLVEVRLQRAVEAERSQIGKAQAQDIAGEFELLLLGGGKSEFDQGQQQPPCHRAVETSQRGDLRHAQAAAAGAKRFDHREAAGKARHEPLAVVFLRRVFRHSSRLPVQARGLRR